MTKTNPRAGAEPQISPTVHGGKAVGRTASSIPATGAKPKPRFDIAEQVRKLGADSLLPSETKPKKAKKKPAKTKAPKRAKKRPNGHPRVGRPLQENKPYTLAATEPWLKMKSPISRATWFRWEKAKLEEK